MNTLFRFVGTVAFASLATLAACRSKDNANDAATTRKDSAGGMGGMPGMSGGRMGNMMGAGMMDSMQTHLNMMDSLGADRMKAMLPMHRQMVANMLSRMSSEMRQMNMSADTAWTATVDSVRQDLKNMPELSGPQLKAMMPAHRARVMRLLQAHRAMMGRKSFGTRGPRNVLGQRHGALIPENRPPGAAVYVARASTAGVVAGLTAEGPYGVACGRSLATSDRVIT